MKSGRAFLWTFWPATVAVALMGYLVARLSSADRRDFLPDRVSAGHHQIEMACQMCHSPFRRTKNEQCLACHAAELRAKNDSHAAAKFADPRNAGGLAQVDARQCVTCHREHRPRQTRSGDVTQRPDFCVRCHGLIGRERPSHAGFAATGCDATGCHHYHDNTGLYEDFLRKHLREPDLLPVAAVPQRNYSRRYRQRSPSRPLTRAEQDGPENLASNQPVIVDWETSSHARAGVNCGDCHHQGKGSAQLWNEHPGEAGCVRCHERQVTGFRAGRHGMRTAAGLSSLSPGAARLIMSAASQKKRVTCASCHGAHSFDTTRASAAACLGCHRDEHSLAYRRSPHYRLWLEECAGILPAGHGVSCATCHLPRLSDDETPAEIFVSHNQSGNLRPNERMARDVCLKCHGLKFALESLAEPRLLRNNFSGRPAHTIDSFEMVERRLGGKGTSTQ